VKTGAAIISHTESWNKIINKNLPEFASEVSNISTWV